MFDYQGDHPAIGFEARRKHIEHTGFTRLTPETISALVKHGPWLEIGAGSGALAAAVTDAGGTVIATDSYDWQGAGCGLQIGTAFTVYRKDAVAATKKIVGRRIGLLTAWPCYDENWAYRAARLLTKGQKLAYIGEGEGGCTADDAFHDLLSHSFSLVEEVNFETFYAIHDRLQIWERI